MKQLGPCTVNVPTDVATLHRLETNVTENTLAVKPTMFAVIVQSPGISVPEASTDELLLPQAVAKIVNMPISANLFILFA